MKKIVSVSTTYILLISLLTMVHLYIPNIQAFENETQLIPNDAIRLRILANSNSTTDQEIKREVRDAVNEKITALVGQLTSKEEAKVVIQENLNYLQLIAKEIVQKQTDDEVKVEFSNVQFPTKLYGEFLYPAGEYEAVLITIGEGVGENWWCVLFPPLCFVDFSKGEAISTGFEDKDGTVVVVDDTQVVEKKFFIAEMIKKWKKKV